MKKEIIKVTKIITFVFVVLFIFIAADKQHIFSETCINPQCSCKWKEFYGLNKNSIDMVYLGSSHANRGFDANYIDNKFRTKSFNMGTPLQKPAESYYVLKEVFAYQKPKVVVFDVFWNVFNKEKYISTKTVDFNCMKPSLNKIQFLLNVFDEGQASAYSYAVRYRYLPAKFSKNTLSQAERNLLAQKNINFQKPNDYIGKGFVRCDDVISPAESAKIAGRTTRMPYGKFIWDKKQWSYMQKIYNFCRAKGVKLVLTTVPSCPSRIKSINKYEYSYNDVNRKVAAFAKAHKLFYKDYNIENGKRHLFIDADFSDNNHLNYKGSHKFADIFVKELKKSRVIK